MATKRTERVSDLIREELSGMLYRKVKDPRLEGITVTGVDVTPDLRHARVHYCFSGGPEDRKKQVADALARSAGFFRTELGKRLHTRTVPELQFLYDESFDYGDKIDRLLGSLHEND